MVTMQSWELARVADNVAIVNRAAGVLLHISPSPAVNWRDAPLTIINPTNRLGRLLQTLIPQLADLGLAEWSPEGFVIPHEDFAELEAHDVDAFADLIEWAPFSLVLESTGWLGGETHSYRYQLCLGARPVDVERLGSVVRRAGTFYRLDAQTFRLLQAIDSFNALDVNQKASPEAFIRFAEIKGLASSVGAQLDQYLLTNRVLVPARVGLDLVVEPGDRISFAPRIEGVPEAAIRWYEKALQIPNLDSETHTALHYELANAYEIAQNKPWALKHFLEVYGSNIDYRDVSERIKSLKS